ncbi:hypothetical protein HML84_13230 [Alcanivorax sp. IO_7]|nr:hypothetical protein HML84_13230 [Alcanivorax sp. IO_7]
MLDGGRRGRTHGRLHPARPGDQKVLTFPAPVTKVATSNPEVARLTVSGDREVLLTAIQEGSAELTIWTRNREAPCAAAWRWPPPWAAACLSAPRCRRTFVSWK